MEAPLEDEPLAGALARIEGYKLAASDSALTFLSSIEPAELLKCVFPDSLVTVSESGRDLGKFSVTVEFARRHHQLCVLLHAQSQGAIDDSPCGTTVTAYLTTDLEVLEEDFHEYIKLEDHSLDRRCHMVLHDGQMVIDKVTTVGGVSKTIEGLVTEGSNFLLMRLIALRKRVPENMTFISFNHGLHIIHNTFSKLGLKQLEVGGETVEVFGLERIVDSVEDSPSTWQCYFLADGHLASRLQVGSPVTMKLLQLPSHIEKEDMQMCSKFLDRKEELKADHASYLRQHPEIRALISDFLQFLLLRKPDDIFQFARDYFITFASRRPPKPSLETP
ncbi:hypothetical protein KUCAC02_018893 [Chaenocephalus aceratus]|uniref:Uncharacterized protein n=1 Tax=Chaenocephalus aceratus TaxID=36190 RepID=A0ACB9W9V8_CHAAC|nr:hypothetical protein KUCAC02_018893 [Chaenocephalus aceratus]